MGWRPLPAYWLCRRLGDLSSPGKQMAQRDVAATRAARYDNEILFRYAGSERVNLNVLKIQATGRRRASGEVAPSVLHLLSLCGVKIETNHMHPHAEGGTDEIADAIAVCFECHAEIHYNDHPIPEAGSFAPTN